jgi:hypothetical protein
LGAPFFAADFLAGCGAVDLVTRPDLVLPKTTDGFSTTAGAAVSVFFARGLLALAFGLAATFFAAGLAAAAFFGAAFLATAVFFGATTFY